eukprot:TRINITY_DN193_c0_g1_i1.p1 TRINITY_DN193_c0_g1~~TRINITY_DN193_c0_g1_i1.p1  ORF type:complete len:483 (-),score=98.65 TRINITY_DN193_c0_g1_i1:286-1734(-)
MGRAFNYVILGGGVSAGYAALEFVTLGVRPGDLCIISAETVAPYERPALSKGFLLAEGPARIPSFHTCVGTNRERLTPKWYKEHGIELILGTYVKSVDLKHRMLRTASGEIIIYKILIIATGATVLRLEEFGVSGADARNICYLRDLEDAMKLVDVMKSCCGGKAVVIGGGYIGMECAAALVNNKIDVIMVFPEQHCMARLFTPEIAAYYENYYKNKGIKFIKGTVMSSFESDSEGKVTAVNLKDGTHLVADMVVVGIGIKPNTELFENQLTIEKGGIKVNYKMQTSHKFTYAVGDVVAFPLKHSGEIRRLEHVDFARKSAQHAVKAIMSSNRIHDLDYLPYFYSRVFTLSWQFFGDNNGRVFHFGDHGVGKFGAFWVDKGHLVGAFLEGGDRDEYNALANAVRCRAAINNFSILSNGLEFAMSFKEVPPQDSTQEMKRESNSLLQEIPYSLQVCAGILGAVAAASFAYWYGKRRRRLPKLN